MAGLPISKASSRRLNYQMLQLKCCPPFTLCGFTLTCSTLLVPMSAVLATLFQGGMDRVVGKLL